MKSSSYTHVTRDPPDINLDATYPEATMKQFITLSSENYVLSSVASINKNTNTPVPNASEIYEANHFVDGSKGSDLSRAGCVTIYALISPAKNLQRSAAKTPPAH